MINIIPPPPPPPPPCTAAGSLASPIAYHAIDHSIGMKNSLSVSVNFISLVTYCVWEEDPQTVISVSFTWACHIAARLLVGR